MPEIGIMGRASGMAVAGSDTAAAIDAAISLCVSMERAMMRHTIRYPGSVNVDATLQGAKPKQGCIKEEIMHATTTGENNYDDR